MRVIFAEDAVREPECWRFLDQILFAVEDGWHEWYIDDPEMLESSAWFQGTNRPSLRKLFEETTVRSAYPSASCLHRKTWLISIGVEADAMAPGAAARFLTQPLRVFMENRFTDGLFLQTALFFLAPIELREFLSDCQGQPMIYDSGGGIGELPKLIDDHLQEMDDNALPPRAVVFADSDARFPNEVSKQAALVAQTCRTHDIDCLILSKRAIENYIPDEILSAWAAEPCNQAARPRVEALCRLTPEQRDHVPMKRRFPDQFNTDDERQLFASVSPDDSALMQQKGFGDMLIELLQSYRNCASANALRRRDQQGDLDSLVSMIAKAL